MKAVRSLKFFGLKCWKKNLGLAKENLRVREGRINSSNIGVWTKGQRSPRLIDGLDLWAESIGASAIIRTNLPPKFDEIKRGRPTLDEAVLYLNSLEGTPRHLAEEYIRKTPAQIRTPYRSRFEKCFGWT